MARTAKYYPKELTPREEEVLGCLCDNLSYKAVGEKLFISKETVRRHAANIYSKLKVHNKTQAMVKFYLTDETPFTTTTNQNFNNTNPNIF